MKKKVFNTIYRWFVFFFRFLKYIQYTYSHIGMYIVCMRESVCMCVCVYNILYRRRRYALNTTYLYGIYIGTIVIIIKYIDLSAYVLAN